MKKFAVMLLALTGLFILTGCGESTPLEVAMEWGEAVLDGDLKSANECSTENTRAINAFVISMLDGDSEKVKEARSKFEEGIRKLENAKVVIEGDVASIYAEEDESKPMTLKKVDGKWKVDARK
ncbi:MAG: DUF4878 domain-containing protein [Lentisphaeria bacterium]|nr:DUF4878 domain-containing protein [Lentisphaeria bacterium]